MTYEDAPKIIEDFDILDRQSVINLMICVREGWVTTLKAAHLIEESAKETH